MLLGPTSQLLVIQITSPIGLEFVRVLAVLVTKSPLQMAELTDLLTDMKCTVPLHKLKRALLAIACVRLIRARLPLEPYLSTVALLLMRHVQLQ